MTNKDFQKLFPEYYSIMEKKNSANFIFIDQSGIKHVNEYIFENLISLSKTDFLFFISSSYASRFCKTEEFQRYLSIDPSEIDQQPYNYIHRLVYKYYKQQIPENIKLFLASFSIKKKSNIYGLIFGSKHVSGIEKFLRVCWNKDPERGEATFDIYGDNIDPKQPYAFPDMNKTRKEKVF